MRLPKLIVTLKNFNPRSRKESDTEYSQSSDTLNIFQSTLSQGERLVGLNEFHVA